MKINRIGITRAFTILISSFILLFVLPISVFAATNYGDGAYGTGVYGVGDATAPTGGSIVYTDGYQTNTSVSLTVSDGTDSESGINTSTRIVQRKSATLSNATCGVYGSFGTISTSGTYPNFTDSTVTSGNCYQYQYQVSDSAGNQATYTSTNTVKVDTEAPTIPGTPYTDSPTINTKPLWVWSVSTDIASGLASPAYTLKWSKDSSFNSGVSNTTVNTNSFTNLSDLSIGTWYFKVNSIDLAGNVSAYSPNGKVIIYTPIPITVSSSSASSTTSTPIVGTILITVVDSNGNIVVGAKVVLDSGQIAYSNSNGIATFYNVVGTTHNVVISFGNTTITRDLILLDSNKDQANNYNFTFVMNDNNTSSQSSPTSTLTSNTSSKSTNTSSDNSISPIVLILLVLILLGGIITFFFFRRRKID